MQAWYKKHRVYLDCKQIVSREMNEEVIRSEPATFEI